MLTIVCDMCRQPIFDSGIREVQAYRFKGSFTTIKVGSLGRKKEVEEVGESYDLCQACYNAVRNSCREAYNGSC